MSGSKAKKTCKFVFKRGVKKGKACGKACVGSYCFSHNKKNLEYKKKYNSKTSKDKKNKKLKDKIDRLFKVKNVADLPSLDNLRIKCLNNGSEIKRLLKVKLGMMDILKENDSAIKKIFDKSIELIENKLKQKYPCKDGKSQKKYDFTDRQGIRYKGDIDCDCDNCIDYRHKSQELLYYPYTDKPGLLNAKYKKVTKKIKELKEKNNFIQEQIATIEQIIEEKKDE